MAAVLSVASVNVNGVRAAVRRGMREWLQTRAPDVLCLQEVRADDAALAQALGPGWHVVHEESAVKGRAGVAIAARVPFAASRCSAHAGPALAGASGRWVEADLTLDGASGAAASILTVVSVYVFTGEAGTARQREKEEFLRAASARLRALADNGRHVLACGDLNVAHTQEDLRNWRGNLTKSGFLASERAVLDDLFSFPSPGGFVDVVRRLSGDVEGPYSWWSWRGSAFDRDVGWRIDYHVASPSLAARATSVQVDRARRYAERWSDHAAVFVEYDVTLSAGPWPLR